ncbi:YesL family protein [Mesobacillus foraminis]|uniref:YesL family protein n=1 Tax=Mesobacillus foraminis TaxID=279826 RepID=UPI001BE811BA|nr:YesL family protein [Mesobacillus foraminis]MBT2757814.1 YesL family protein [Mesobacillus foraminis]
MSGLMSAFYRISEWIMRFAYLNILWIFFTLTGLIVLGIFPATVAIFAVNRKWVMGETDIPVFETFWSTYKTEFLKSNLLGLTLIAIGCILYMDYRIIMDSASEIGKIFFIPLLVFIFLYSLLLLYVFPLFTNYDIKIFQVIKTSLIMMVLYPLSTIMMVISCVIVYYVMNLVPGLILFFGLSSLSFLLTWCAHYAFAKNQKKEALPE